MITDRDLNPFEEDGSLGVKALHLHISSAREKNDGPTPRVAMPAKTNPTQLAAHFHVPTRPELTDVRSIGEPNPGTKPARPPTPPLSRLQGNPKERATDKFPPQ